MSQNELANASGISRRMITNLESGETNVSLASLDRLAEALGVAFVSMVADPEAGSERVEIVAWRGENDDSKGVLLGRVPAAREAELWRWSLAPGERYVCEPDPAGWHEMVFVTEGRLRIEKGDASITIERGDFAIYSSAQAYAYSNASSDTVRFVRNVVS